MKFGFVVQVYSVVPLLYSSDKDADEIPDAWEARYFANIRAALPQQDVDEDGFSLNEEYIAGSSPIEKKSVFEISDQNGGVAFQTLLDRNYGVWYASNLLQEAWQSITNLEGNGAVFFIPPEGRRGFYQVDVWKGD